MHFRGCNKEVGIKINDRGLANNPRVQEMEGWGGLRWSSSLVFVLRQSQEDKGLGKPRKEET